MRLVVLFLAIGLMSFTPQTVNDSRMNFEKEITEIVEDFKSNAGNRLECERILDNSVRLLKEINRDIRKTKKQNKRKLWRLKNYKNETEALIEYIATVGDVGNFVLSIEDFDRINKRVGGEIEVIRQEGGLIDVISVRIGDYESFLLTNNTTKSYKTKYNYRWTSSNGVYEVNGTGKMLIPRLNMHNIYSNRDYKKDKDLSLFEVSCREL